MKLKVVMTLGPASSSPETIARLLETADRFRLNTAHLSPERLADWLQKLARLFDESRRTIPVVIDLQGAKMRVGEFPAVARLPPEIRIRCQPRSTTASDVLGVPHPELFAQLVVGEILSLNDDRIRLQIVERRKGELCARVLRNGPLSSFKGINRREHPIACRALSERDAAALQVAGTFPFVQFALSFVHTGEEATLLRSVSGRHLIAKIERPDAMAHLRTIAEQFDELWLCRGDLGAQAGLENLGAIQEAFGVQTTRLDRPTYLAGQVLEHMTYFDRPTRTEVVHLYDLERVGWHGIVLSDETAMGRDPVKVAEFLQSLRQARAAGSGER